MAQDFDSVFFFDEGNSGWHSFHIIFFHLITTMICWHSFANPIWMKKFSQRFSISHSLCIILVLLPWTWMNPFGSKTFGLSLEKSKLLEIHFSRMNRAMPTASTLNWIMHKRSDCVISFIDFLKRIYGDFSNQHQTNFVNIRSHFVWSDTYFGWRTMMRPLFLCR